MNLTASPPVDLSGLAELGDRPAKAAGVPGAAVAVGASAIAAGVGLWAWRFASLGRPRRRGPNSRGLLLAAGGAMGLGLARWQLQRLFTLEPEYEVESHAGPLEVRRYGSIAIARTTVDAGWEPALDLGFRRLATFISGANREHAKWPMQSPVMASREGEGYRFAFVLPPGVESSLPNDESVTLDVMPPRRVAVLRFRGRYDEASIDLAKRRLILAAAEARLVTLGEPWFAGYDPPSTLPVLRRNEMVVELSSA